MLVRVPVFAVLSVSSMFVTAQDPAGIRPTPPPVTVAMAWFETQQQKDGGFVDAAGKPDLEGAALFALVCLGDGTTTTAGRHHPALKKCVDWLLAAQRENGSFEDTAPGALKRHAQIVYALVEATGLGQDTGPLRTATTRALKSLLAQRGKDGGWSMAPGAVSDPLVTAWAVVAIASAKGFQLPVDEKPEALVTWFDERDGKEPLPVAAELFCRYFVGQQPKTTPRMSALADLLPGKADFADAHTAYWTTYALFQRGGRPWSDWAKRLAASKSSQVREGEHKGSWEPAAGATRVATTALQALSFEVPYRYARLVR